MKRQIGVPIFLIALGAIALYVLGRIDAAAAARDSAAVHEAKALASNVHAYHHERDSLTALADSLQARSDSLDAVRGRLAATVQAAEDQRVLDRKAARESPLRDLLPRLQLMAESDNRFVTDSNGVRHLAGLEVDARNAQHVELALRELLGADTLAINNRDAAIGVLTARALRSEARADTLQKAMSDLLEVHECRILWLIPCPSRTVAAVAGAGAGVIAGIVLAKQ